MSNSASSLIGSRRQALSIGSDAAMRAHVRYGLAEVSAHISDLAASEWREPRHQGQK